MVKIKPPYPIFCRFTYVDVGAQGRASDGGVFSACSLEQAILRNNLNIPPPRLLPQSAERFPYVILGDEAFPLKPYLMRPYPRRTLTHEKKVRSYVSLALNVKSHYEHLHFLMQQTLF